MTRFALMQRHVEQPRSGTVSSQLIITAGVLMMIAAGFYFLAEQSLTRLYHFVSILSGSMYL